MILILKEFKYTILSYIVNDITFNVVVDNGLITKAYFIAILCNKNNFSFDLQENCM